MPATKTMQRDPGAVLHATDTVEQAYEKLQAAQSLVLPVVDENNMYLGQFGTHTLMKLVLPKVATLENGLRDLSFSMPTLDLLRNHWAAAHQEPISRHVEKGVSVHPDTPMMETALLMYKEHIACLPVVADSGHLVGVITAWEIIQAAAKGA